MSDTVPHELLLSIVNITQDQGSLHNPYKLLQRSRPLYNLALLHLGRHIELSNVNRRFQDLDTHEAVYKFGCQVLPDCGQAKYVKNFTFRESLSEPSRGKLFSAPPTNEEEGL